LRHPLAAFDRTTLWHLLQHYTEHLDPDAPVSVAESEAAVGDEAIAQRLMNVFHEMIEHEQSHIAPERRPNSGIWEMVRHEFHGEFYRIMADRDAAALAAYLRNGLRRAIAYGLGPGAEVFDAMRETGAGRHANLALLADRLASLAVAIGALPHENPEQGRYGTNLTLAISDLATLIEAHLGVHIFRPPVAGLFGVEVAPGRIIDVRVPDDAYCAFRLRMLSDTLGFSRICEIGAGFGGTAFQAARHGLVPYTIIDLPAINVLQGYFLMKIFGGDAVRMFSETVPDRPFSVLPYWMFFDSSVAFDLVFNRDSMPEMPEARVREYLHEIEERRCALLSVNQESEGIAERAGAQQLMVHRLAKAYPGLRSASRHPYWTRKGYVEELFLPLPDRPRVEP